MGSLVEIARFYDPEEAYCAQGYLRSCGIDAFVQNEHHLSVNPSLRIALGGYGLLGFADMASEAKAALKAITGDAAASMMLSEGDAGSDVEFSNRRNWFWLPVAVVSGVPFLPRFKSTWGLLMLTIPGGLLWLGYALYLISTAGWLQS